MRAAGRFSLRVLLRILVAAALAVPTAEGTWYVDALGGDDAASGRTWAEAFAGVGRALEASRAQGGGRIEVAAGTYSLSGAVLDFPVTLIGGYPPGGGLRDRTAGPTVLDAGGAPRVLSFDAGSGGSLLDGFTLRGASDAALVVEETGVLARNCDVSGNPGIGVLATVGRIERNRVASNGLGGIAVRQGDGTCAGRVLVRENLVEGNTRFGIAADDGGCGWYGEPSIRVEHNRVRGTRSATGEAVGLSLVCCPRVFDNEVTGTEGAGVAMPFTPWEPPLSGPPGTPVLQATIAGNAGPGIVAGDALRGVDDLVLSHVILWGNGGGDIQNAPATVDVTYTLSEAPLPGTGNLSAQDPVFAAGPAGDLYLSQTAAGQAIQSPASDAGARTSAEAGLAFRTTRTDEVRDVALVDLGFHYDPALSTIFRGPDPSALPPLAPDVTLPFLDPGALDPPLPDLLFYAVDSGEEILLRRDGSGVEVRFLYQAFDGLP